MLINVFGTWVNSNNIAFVDKYYGYDGFSETDATIYFMSQTEPDHNGASKTLHTSIFDHSADEVAQEINKQLENKDE